MSRRKSTKKNTSQAMRRAREGNIGAIEAYLYKIGRKGCSDNSWQAKEAEWHRRHKPYDISGDYILPATGQRGA